MKSIIAIHEENVLNRLYSHLRYDNGIDIIAICRDAIETVKTLDTLTPQLVLLDLQMPRLDGFEILNSLTRLPNDIVFLTDNTTSVIKTLQGYNQSYLLKSYAQNDLTALLDKMRNQAPLANQKVNELRQDVQKILSNRKVQNELLSTDESQRLAMKLDSKLHFVNLLDIIWIEAYEYYLKVNLQNNSYLVRGNLEGLTDLLKEHFTQITQSSIVNLNYIMFVDRNIKTDEVQIVLQNGTPLTIDKEYEPEVIRRIS
ncbi:MAG: LytTR family transcriptional regulator DNA-binding domain-containing protein [Bacteroidota bacterium]